MALKALMIRKKLDDKRKALEVLREKDAEFTKREAELETAIEEASTDEERSAVEEEVEKFEEEKAAHEEEKTNLEGEVRGLEDELKETEESEEAAPQERTVQGNKRPELREESIMITRDAKKIRNTRDKFEAMTDAQRSAIFDRDDVTGWIDEIRAHIKEKRELTNVGLTIPEVFLGYIRENVLDYSKLYRRVNVQPLAGTGREVVMGSVPEAVWTECCAALNEMSLSFNDVEIDCFKVGGFFKVCNAVLEDSAIGLAALILDAIGQAIGLALDKAILYGRNTASNQKMPLGIVSRLAQTSEPAGYPATARPWVDLHTSNIKTISSSVTGIDLFKAITLDAGNAKGKYARGNKTWVMNESTYTTLKAEAMSVNAAGAIVSGVEGTMPVVGGDVVVLDFIPDNVIIGGYFELYLLGERGGSKFAQSEHAFFIQDQTVFKGTARYDGAPVIAEAFVAIGINSVTPSASMDFAPDNANSVQSILLNYGAATLAKDATLQLIATTLPVEGPVTWESSDDTKVTVSDDGLLTGIATSGSAVITATSGNANATVTITCSAGV